MESQAKAALGTVTDGFEQLKADGFLKHFQEYNVELIRPLKPATELGFEGLKKAIVGYFTPSHSKLQAQVGFILFNVLTFWFGALEAVLTFSITSLLLNACLSYIIAYSIWWAIIINKKKLNFKVAIAITALYLVWNAFSAFTSLILVVPAIIYAIKALMNFNVLVYAVKLYKQEFGTDASLL
eukprot:CAMPEP_0181191832 /NCGR_PEP_ID=MMETSP1096-20121128/12945_1 /TAXON_ID=156174 ORGANISM="Chrysochromulina ericina, Strain CCMP281" /NCGR_SAMPLE_ID=MMETSP1096 /ASSEMBLY_ACC=CAM_ASM_000453 /LENGTH=182 /DNA_ID=CAMNT_0023281157 /DNA_START=32 /DNA_END=580 /DNA_ORIENTATION=+